MKNNEWLKRHAARVSGIVTTMDDVAKLRKSLRVTLWSEDAHGRHQLSLGVLPFEEVMSIHFAEGAVVSGFSLWLNDKEVFSQYVNGFKTSVTIPSDGSLNIDNRSLLMKLVPCDLS